MTYAPAKFKVAMSNGLGGNYIAKYPLHHETYAPATFEIATPNGSEADAQYLTLTLG